MYCVPHPTKKVKFTPAILYTAQLVGVTKLFKVGGIQAIAGLTLGTESMPNVYKIFGPGNQYVTAAKQYALSQGVAIDMPAGPSELMVVADQEANQPMWLRTYCPKQNTDLIVRSFVFVRLKRKISSSRRSQYPTSTIA